MKILFLDIETSAHLVDTWGLFDQNIGLNQLHVPSYMICWAARWHHKKEMYFQRGNGPKSLKELHKLLDEADVVIGYNSKQFDIKVINREFVEAGLPPPSPVKQIDLLTVVRSKFRFASNKLAFVAPALGVGNKVGHPGHELWTRCLNGDEAAWKIMRRYNCQDVNLLVKLYDKLLPWISNHPNRALYDDKGIACTNCGSVDIQSRGVARTQTCVYQRYRCNNCWKWFRGVRNMGPPPGRRVANI